MNSDLNSHCMQVGPESRPRDSGVNAKLIECLAAEKPPRLVSVND